MHHAPFAIMKTGQSRAGYTGPAKWPFLAC
jgi:hypothetical protein